MAARDKVIQTAKELVKKIGWSDQILVSAATQNGYSPVKFT